MQLAPVCNACIQHGGIVRIGSAEVVAAPLWNRGRCIQLGSDARVWNPLPLARPLQHGLSGPTTIEGADLPLNHILKGMGGDMSGPTTAEGVPMDCESGPATAEDVDIPLTHRMRTAGGGMSGPAAAEGDGIDCESGPTKC